MLLCKCLNVSRSVYYYHQNNKSNSYHEANKLLDEEIIKIYESSKGRYGSPKITKELHNNGFKVSQKRVSRRMKVLGIKSCVVKKFKPSTSSKSDDTKIYHDLLKQDFTAISPGLKWVGDITYIYTKECGWTYLAVVMDLFDLKVIGWEYSTTMTEEISIKAFEKACKNRKLQAGLIFHSDRGSQYTSNNYERMLNELGVKHSYSKKGYPYDNASMESFNSILKKEEINHRTFITYNEAKLAIFEFIEGWYNTRRIHGSLGYITPNQKFMMYQAALK